MVADWVKVRLLLNRADSQSERIVGRENPRKTGDAVIECYEKHD